MSKQVTGKPEIFFFFTSYSNTGNYKKTFQFVKNITLQTKCGNHFLEQRFSGRKVYCKVSDCYFLGQRAELYKIKISINS